MIDKIFDVDYDIITAKSIGELRENVQDAIDDKDPGQYVKRVEGGIFYDDGINHKYCQVVVTSKIEYEVI